jgi:hopanoid biosynthesis associated radical SAM protein HpnH
VSVPLRQQLRVGSYIVKQKLKGRKRYPLVLMLEPLFQCNLACPGCGKIDYPKPILNKRLSVQECIDAAEECGAPVVSIPGGEPLIHKEIDQIVAELVKRKFYVILCTNALLLRKKMHLFTPSHFLTFSVHLDGLRDEHDAAVDQEGVFDTAVAAIKEAREAGFKVNVNATLFNNAQADKVAEFLDYVHEMGIDGVTISPGYAYERAPDQEHFLNRSQTKTLFRDLFRYGKGKKWRISQSSLFLDFLAGNQDYRCTPWSNPTRNIFGWQRPCYLLNEGYASSFKELMEETEWDSYGTGNYEKCANCMVHCGYEGTAVEDAVRNPLKALWVSLRGPRTEGPMAPEIPLDQARPAEYVFEDLVANAMASQDKPKDKAANDGGTAKPAAGEAATAGAEATEPTRRAS